MRSNRARSHPWCSRLLLGWGLAALPLLGLGLGASQATAQSPEEIDPSLTAQALTGPQLDESLTELRATFSEIETFEVADFPISSPAYAIAIPTGYGVGFGSVYLVAGGVFEQRFEDNGQGGIGVGFGLGDPAEWVGVEVNYAIADLDEGLGGFSFKIHRTLVSTSEVGWSLAGGWEDAISTGDPIRDSSAYGSTSVIFKIKPDIDQTFSRLALTVGVGGGRFRTEDDILDGRDTVGVFGSGAIRVTRAISVIGEWTGQDLAAGVSVAPFSDINFYITPAIRDIAGAGDEARFALSGGLSLQF